MKEYKSNEELIDYLEDKGVIINDKDEAISVTQKYTYYSVINSYKIIHADL